MKVCVVCQTELKDEARFCPECGAEQPKAEAAPGEDPLLGLIIAKKFKIERVLGVGGMGKVYKARQLALDKAVVVKVLHDQFRDDPQLVQRFQREARAASRLNHPNSIQIIDFGQDDTGVVFMAMEFLQGQDLFALLKKEGALSPDRVARVMIQVCSALAEAHEQNVIHRDLKPENIMVEDRRGQRDFVKVLDFGIAKIQDPAETGGVALTQAGMVCGTPEYMSPEQARGLQLDARSDIYALGVIMYQLSTGELPFVADTPIGIVTKHILEAPVPPRHKRPEIPELLEQIILKAMEKDVAGRFASVVDVGESLELLLRSLPQDQASGFSPGRTIGGPTTPTGVSGPVGTGNAARLPTNVPPTSTTPTVAGTAVAMPLTQNPQPLVAANDPPVVGEGRGMKIAAAGVVAALLVVGVGVVAFRDKLLGTTPVVVDAGPAVVAVVTDAGTPPQLPPPTVDAGMPTPPQPVVDAGPTVVASLTTPETPPTPPEKKPPPSETTTTPEKKPPEPTEPAEVKTTPVKSSTPTKADKDLVAKARSEYLGAAGCSAATGDALVAVAQRLKSWPDPMQTVALCAFKSGNLGAACAAVDEYESRGAKPAAVAQLRKVACKK